MAALEEEILGVAAGCAGVVKAHGKSFQRGQCGGAFVADGQTAQDADDVTGVKNLGVARVLSKGAERSVPDKGRSALFVPTCSNRRKPISSVLHTNRMDLFLFLSLPSRRS